MKIKKLLAFLISVAMIVGMVPTFVFAKEIDFEAEEPAATEETKENSAFDTIVKLLIGDGSIENIPFGTAKAGLKIAKIFLKLAKAFIKVGDALGFIDGDKIFMDLVNSVAGMLNNGGNEEAPAEPAPETPAQPANP